MWSYRKQNSSWYYGNNRWCLCNHACCQWRCWQSASWGKIDLTHHFDKCHLQYFIGSKMYFFLTFLWKSRGKKDNFFSWFLFFLIYHTTILHKHEKSFNAMMINVLKTMFCVSIYYKKYVSFNNIPCIGESRLIYICNGFVGFLYFTDA